MTTDLAVAPGSLLVLYTDGLVEARGSDIDERLTELTHALAEPYASLESLCDGLLTRLAPVSADDDIALLIARIGTASPST
jgi:serine phosphatase RsbU (regulator of sigma subunit)